MVVYDEPMHVGTTLKSENSTIVSDIVSVTNLPLSRRQPITRVVQHWIESQPEYQAVQPPRVSLEPAGIMIHIYTERTAAERSDFQHRVVHLLDSIGHESYNRSGDLPTSYVEIHRPAPQDEDDDYLKFTLHLPHTHVPYLVARRVRPVCQRYGLTSAYQENPVLVSGNRVCVFTRYPLNLEQQGDICREIARQAQYGHRLAHPFAYVRWRCSLRCQARKARTAKPVPSI